jgi:hypothetical protein
LVSEFDITQITVLTDPFTGNIVDRTVTGSRFSDHRVVGAVLGTFTLRYPIPHSRLSPYLWGGVGAIFGGGESDKLIDKGGGFAGFEAFENFETQHSDFSTELMGQFGGGLEFRFTPYIGLTSDFSWNVIDKSKSNFGMARAGLNFAF